ncbi:MAG: Ig-like domain-containing protein, partial [Bacteroidota bacterium]
GRTNFGISFDEVVSAGNGNIYLVETVTDEIVKTTTPNTFNTNSTYQSFDFEAGLLKPNTNYHIELDAGTYVDFFGNDFEGISDETMFGFTTEEAETIAPVVSYLYPGNGGTNISISTTSFQIQFDEDVIALEGGSISHHIHTEICCWRTMLPQCRYYL